MVGPLETWLESYTTSSMNPVSVWGSNYRKVNAIIRKIVESNKDLFPDLMPHNFTVKIIRSKPWIVGTAH
ncbi:hypothetical protein ACJMK2_040472, partial [Sinanodonta woodiana]